MRLTKKIFTDLYASPCDEDTEEKQAEQQWKICNKLGQLEDIEDELEIDLALRHKVETSGILYCIDYKHNLVETRYCHSYGKNGVGLELPMDIEPYFCITLYYWKDYGKTWALTKEELL